MIAGIFDRLFKRKPKTPIEDEYIETSELEYPEDDQTGERMIDFDQPQFLDDTSDLEMNSRIFYDMNKLEYHLKLHNKSTDMIGDITAILKTKKNSVIDIVDSKQVVEMLEPGKSTTLKFKLKPNYAVGKSGLYGKIEYFDFKSKERNIFRLPQAYADFEFSKLQNERIDDDKWRLISSKMRSYEIETEVLEAPPDKVFDVFKNVMNNLGLFMLPPIENINLYRGIAKFYGFDDDDNEYAIEVQVIGDKAKSKVLFRIWSDEPQDAMALAFKTIDIIDGAIKIKDFILKK